jgi:hypothetical protein
MSKGQKDTAAQKALRKEVSSRLGFALDHLKTLLGEKKFNNRIRKAAKLLTEGMNSSPAGADRPETKQETPAKKAAPQKEPVKKAAPAKKTATAKKAPVKAAAKTPVKKAAPVKK